jgi:hypothetical protein
MEAEKIRLAEMILDLRRELQRAQQLAQNDRLRFRVEDIELEVQVGVTQEGQAEGGVSFWVYTAKVAGSLAKETVHTLRIKLKPLTVDGDVRKDLELSDKDE